MPPKSPRLSGQESDDTAAGLVAFRAAGHDSLAHCPPDGLAYGKSAKLLKAELARMAAAAGRLGVPVTLNVDTLGKMRRVAAEYTAGQVADLADLVRRHRSRFSTSHLMRLLALPDRKVRDGVMAKAVRGSWSLATLERHVQVAREARRAGSGRMPFVPDDDRQRLVVLEGLCIKWGRWTELAADVLPADVRKRVKAADAAVAAVHEVLAKHLPRVKAAGGNEMPGGRPARSACS